MAVRSRWCNLRTKVAKLLLMHFRSMGDAAFQTGGSIATPQQYKVADETWQFDDNLTRRIVCCGR